MKNIPFLARLRRELVGSGRVAPHYYLNSSISKLGLICSLFSATLTAIPALEAERIAFSYPPFGEFHVSTHSLEMFAQGKIDDDFAFYAKRATPQQLAQLRNFLQKRFEVSPTLVSQFTYSPLGATVVRRLGEVLQTDSRQNGFYALRAALILSAADPNGLTVVNVLRRFPSYSVRLNLTQGLEVMHSFSELLRTTHAVIAGIQQESSAEAAIAPVDFSGQPDLRLAGSFRWQKATLNLNDQARHRHFPVDLYLPQQTSGQQPVPVIVISHGAAENRNMFAYLAQQLVSYGFAVTVIEHPGIDSQRFQQYFAGLADPPEAMESIDQPLDVKYLLDELQRRSASDPALQGRLNLQQVGIVGHSLGGYTALTLAGAKINFEQLRRDCYPNNSLNVSLLVQCKTANLSQVNYPLQDNRVKAVLAINPVTSSILGQRGLGQIQVPTMLVASSEDIIAPAVPEQIRPFTWLTTPAKYLVSIEKGTHFSALEEMGQGVFPVPVSLIGPNPAIARSYLNALSVAFFQTHLANRPEYRSYLSASYAQFISQSPLNLSLVKSLTTAQVEQLLHEKTASR